MAGAGFIPSERRGRRIARSEDLGADDETERAVVHGRTADR
jgi:hypothetical protein